ncbi:hypothetical protein [Streptomyces sp. NPDC017993]|uniref:hypothetical protein n=1 Tax=Streptomyces sp. NPDC017993 TaxID=3365027 RepID=UPI00379375DE
MPIPDIHRQRLDRALREHDRALERISREKIRLETEEEIHRILLALGRDPGVLDGLCAIHEDPEIIDELEKDADSVLQERGVSLPSGVTIRVAEPHRAVQADISVRGTVFVVQWDLELGLSTALASGPTPADAEAAAETPRPRTAHRPGP